MKIKTADLIDLALGWAVAVVEGWEEWDAGNYWEAGGFFAKDGDFSYVLFLHNYKPYSDWAQGGPIIEREWIELGAYHDQWRAVFHGEDGSIYQDGPTPLIAAMRCYCCAKLGEYVDIPEELCQQPNS